MQLLFYFVNVGNLTFTQGYVWFWEGRNIDWLFPTCSNLGSSLQPRYVPWPRIKPTTFWCTGCSNWATQPGSTMLFLKLWMYGRILKPPMTHAFIGPALECGRDLQISVLGLGCHMAQVTSRSSSVGLTQSGEPLKGLGKFWGIIYNMVTIINEAVLYIWKLLWV